MLLLLLIGDAVLLSLMTRGSAAIAGGERREWRWAFAGDEGIDYASQKQQLNVRGHGVSVDPRNNITQAELLFLLLFDLAVFCQVSFQNSASVFTL